MDNVPCAFVSDDVRDGLEQSRVARSYCKDRTFRRCHQKGLAFPRNLEKSHFNRERDNANFRTANEKTRRDNHVIFFGGDMNIITLLTCILTLAVSNGKVAKSAMQAAVPAVSNFTPSEKSSDIPCFMIFTVQLFFFNSKISLPLIILLMRAVKGACMDTSCRIG